MIELVFEELTGAKAKAEGQQAAFVKSRNHAEERFFTIFWSNCTCNQLLKFEFVATTTATGLDRFWTSCNRALYSKQK
jgi:hypothetical protein